MAGWSGDRSLKQLEGKWMLEFKSLLPLYLVQDPNFIVVVIAIVVQYINLK